jgi:hypothetical protein
MKSFCSMAAGGAMAIACALAAGSAQAVTVQRSFLANAPAFCQASLHAYDVHLRKRPLAIQNEGTSNAFVSCSLLGQDSHPWSTTKVAIWATNNDDAPHTLTCTGISGYNTGPNIAVVKTINIPASGQGPPDVAVAWLPEDGVLGRLFSVSCILPPGVSLNDIMIDFIEDVGN